MQLRQVISWRSLGLAAILPLLLVAAAPSRAQDAATSGKATTSGVAAAPSGVAAAAVSPKPGDNSVPNAAVTARWPLEDTPQHTVGRAPTPPEGVVIEPDEPKSRGWSTLLPKDPAPAGKAAGALAVSKKAQRASHAHVAKSKSARTAKAKSPRAGVAPRSHRSAAAVRPRTSGHAKSSRAANSMKVHRPLALTPPVLRTPRRAS